MTGASNQVAATGSDVVVVAVPYDGYTALLKHLSGALAGKILVSCVNPLGFDKRGAYGLDIAHGSAAEEAAGDLSHEDVLVVGDDADAKDIVCTLSAAVSGRPGVDAGALRLAASWSRSPPS